METEMGKVAWRISAFGDEISDDLSEQLRVMRLLKVGYLELRGVWGKNVLHLNDEEVQAIAAKCAEAQIAVSAVGSPVGKSPITQPISVDLQNLHRIFAIAEGVGTRLVRVFSFYPPTASETPISDAALVEESIARLTTMSEAAQAAGFQLVLENENGIVGDSVARCKRLLEAVPSNLLGFAWDPANFVHVGESAAVSDGWDALGPRTQHVHVKDYKMATGEILPAGEGDGQFDLLLSNLANSGYRGFLAMEPHLAIAGHSSGFSGADGMERAVAALRSLMESVGVDEEAPTWAGREWS